MSAPLRVLVCIPHYFRRTGTSTESARAQNGSATDALAERAQMFGYCLQHLSAHLRRTRFVIGSSGEQTIQGGELGMDHVETAPSPVVGTIDIQCVRDDNLLDQFPMMFATAHLCDINPRLLGYRCRLRFVERIDDYDLFCFLEDDTAILDPQFFPKVHAFYQRFGEDCVLLPSRYELTGIGDNAFRSHLDGPLLVAQRVPLNLNAPRELVAETFTGPVKFALTEAAMAGCYVLTASQIRRWMTQPDFAQPVPELVARGYDTLEMTQIPLMGTLPIYRPAAENLDFLEVHHVPNRLSNATTPRRRLEATLRGKALHLRS